MMEASSIGAFAPAALLCAALGSWSLTSFLFLLAFFIVQYNTQQRGPHARPRPILWMLVVLLATTVIVAQGVLVLVWATVGSSWELSESNLLKLLGLVRSGQSKGHVGIVFTLLPQFAVALIATCALYQEQQQLRVAEQVEWDEEGYRWRTNLMNLILPAVQILIGVARPSWIALPYFLCSNLCLFDWSRTGNNRCFKWSWGPMLWCSASHIVLLYLYQLPVSFPFGLSDVGEYVGLYKALDNDVHWPECMQVVSLISFYILICLALRDTRDESRVDSSDDGSGVRSSLPRYYNDLRSPESSRTSNDHLTESLLSMRESPPTRETIFLSRRWDADQRRVIVLQHATVNFITYGFPICLIALVSWSFIYASFCAFGLLLYVGYILFAFPSIIKLRKLNPVLLGFILLWSCSTYVFNAGFQFITEQSGMGTGIWHSIGLWHYLTPGLFIFAQYALGVLVATDIFVSNVILKSLSDVDPNPGDEHASLEDQDDGQEDWKVLILAVIAWTLRRSSYVITLVLILFVGMKSGILHAVYLGFFLVYLVSSELAKKTRQYFILYCELHFSALYLFRLEWVREVMDAHESRLKPILRQLGLWEKGTLQDFLGITLLVCFLAVQCHGVKVLRSLSATLNQSPQFPLSWGILRMGSRRSVLLSVYASQNFGQLQEERDDDVNWVTEKLAAMADIIRKTYRSFGTYIAYGTVSIVICFVKPNYTSLGYLWLLLVWMIGRQILGHTSTRLWYPLMVYAGLVFVARYTLAAIPIMQKIPSQWFSLYDDLGFDSDASLIGNLWDPLAILTAMQLYRFERCQSLEEQEHARDSSGLFWGPSELVKRLVILHCGKVLTLVVFYASISPVSVTGFLYLLMLILTCNMSKTSRLPGQLYSMYTGVLIICEYLFQMWGQRAEMFPGQSHGEFARWLGFCVYENGFHGTEHGLRSKALILVVCILQYCSFHWLDQLPQSLRMDDFGEPCLLFSSYRRLGHLSYQNSLDPDYLEERSKEPPDEGGSKISSSDAGSGSIGISRLKSAPSADGADKGKQPTQASVRFSDTPTTFSNLPDVNIIKNESLPIPSRRSAHGFPWGNAAESRKWTKKAELLVKQEKYEAQLRTLSVYLKYIIENISQLYGLEISMLSLLVASFIVLNVTSLFYILILGLCILLRRRTIRIIWPFFVTLFAIVLVTEYAVLGNAPPSWSVPPTLNESKIQCNQCASSSSGSSSYCWQCWLGLVVDDWEMLGAHFMVFFFAALKLRANMSSGNRQRSSLHSIVPVADRLSWKEFSFENSMHWTWLDQARFFFYRHLLHVVLVLVFATGTLQYDVLHLGYLTFALVFFRMRSTIMLKRNSIFKYLRLYNFILIGTSLIYQSPYFKGVSAERCAVIADVYKIVGLYKMKFGFHITARSAIVDITIFCLAGLQAYVFRSRVFDKVSRYLESEQLEARAHAQEDKAAWKKEHLQHLRATEEQKLQRRRQVEKMKTDMLHLQLRLDVLSSAGKFNEVVTPMVELDGTDIRRHTPRRPGPTPRASSESADSHFLEKLPSESHLPSPFQPEKNAILVPPLDEAEDPEGHYHLVRRRLAPQLPDASRKDGEDAERGETSDGPSKILRRTFSQSDAESGGDSASLLPAAHAVTRSSDSELQRNRATTGVHLLEDSVAHVQSFSNKALRNLVGLLNLEQTEEEEDDESSSAEKMSLSRISSEVREEKLKVAETWRRVSILRSYFYIKLTTDTDIICYFFFVLVFIWNFSVLTLVYPATLFLYAVLANPGPSQQFWFFMLVYTELNILLQYMYQIHVQSCDGQDVSVWLRKIGIPGSIMSHSFVISVLPLFLVYLSTSMQSSIKARDGEWVFVGRRKPFRRNHPSLSEEGQTRFAALKSQVLGVPRMVRGTIHGVRKGIARYWVALGSGSEAPPHFVQVSLDVGKWPEDGLQPAMIEDQFNMLLHVVHSKDFPDNSNITEIECTEEVGSRIRVESIEHSSDDPNLSLAVLEVIYAAPPEGFSVDNDHLTLTPAADVAAQLLRAKENGLLEESNFVYPIVSVIPGGKREVDLYAPIFGTDMLSFLYVAIFYQSTQKHNEQLLNVYRAGDQFPKEFILVLGTLFFLIMLDRVLYLSAFAKGRAVYYFFSLFLYTFYVSHSVWEMVTASGTDYVRHFWLLVPLRAFYMLKALSLYLQAVQLKYGLPHNSFLFNQYLTRKVSNTRLLGFRLYRALPFLYEMRCLLDWSCTRTALSMYDWLKLEDIYASLFLVQCNIKLVREKHRLGEQQRVWIKFVNGVLIFCALMGIIWAPMIIYSSGNPTNFLNQIYDVRASVDLKVGGGTISLFKTSLCQTPSYSEVFASCSSIDGLEDLRNKIAYSDLRDVQLVCCKEDSDSLWMVPPPTVRSLANSVDDGVKFRTTWEFTRERPKGKEVTSYAVFAELHVNSTNVTHQLKQVLSGNRSYLTISDMYPRYLHVPGSSEVRPEGDMELYQVSANLTLNREESTWWSISRTGAHGGDNCSCSNGPMAVTISEEVPTGILGDTLSKFSIWSLYLTFVLAVGRVIRLQCSDIRTRIPFENFPACDRLLAICEDIYAARAERELELEEGLFWTLIKIYRSPHILMEYTKAE